MAKVTTKTKLSKPERMIRYFQRKRNTGRAIGRRRLEKEFGRRGRSLSSLLSRARKLCPEGWRIRTEIITDDTGLRWSFFRYCHTVDFFQDKVFSA